MMMRSFVPTVVLLATFLASSAGQVTQREVKLSIESEIFDNGWIQLICNSFRLGMSSNTGVTQLELRRTVSRPPTQETIATYRPVALSNPGLTIGEKYRDDKRWTINGYGQEPTGLTDSFYMTAVVNKTRCSDGGEYYCIATYTDDRDRERQIIGQMHLPAVAEITRSTLTGSNGNRSNHDDVQTGDIITVDCNVKGPNQLELSWQKDGKVIGVDINPAEVKDVDNHKEAPSEIVDNCPQYQYRSTIVFQASPTVRYECKWSYKTKTQSVFFDMGGSSGWSWSSLNTDVTYSDDDDDGFNLWYVFGPILGVVALCLIGVAVIYFIRRRYK